MSEPLVTWRGRVASVRMRYPRSVMASDTVAAVELELEDVRAAPALRVEYDFDRDGWRILIERHDPGVGPGASEDPHPHPDDADHWREAAFISAWNEPGITLSVAEVAEVWGVGSRHHQMALEDGGLRLAVNGDPSEWAVPAGAGHKHAGKHAGKRGGGR